MNGSGGIESDDEKAIKEAQKENVRERLWRLAVIAKRVEQRAFRVARENRESTIAHAAHFDKLGTIARIVNTKNHQMAEGHQRIWDDDLKGERHCQSNEEVLQATADHHQYWTNPTKARKKFFFFSAPTFTDS